MLWNLNGWIVFRRSRYEKRAGSRSLSHWRSQEARVIPQRSIVSLSLSLFHRYDRSHFVDKLEISGNCYAIDRVSKHRGPVMSHAIFSHITTSLKRHQLELIRSNKKLCFYSIFKTDVSRSDYLEQVKNQKHRRAVAKLRSGNHSLRIESGRHCIPKLPESLRICQ